jgi:hypothetical protein
LELRFMSRSIAALSSRTHPDFPWDVLTNQSPFRFRSSPGFGMINTPSTTPGRTPRGEHMRGGTWGSDGTPATGSSVMGFAAMPPMKEDDPDALDAFLDQLRGVWHHQPTLSGEMPTMGGRERAFMQTSPLEAHLLTPSAVVVVDARNSALLFKIRRSRNTSRRGRGSCSSADRRLLYGDGIKVRV